MFVHIRRKSNLVFYDLFRYQFWHRFLMSCCIDLGSILSLFGIKIYTCSQSFSYDFYHQRIIDVDRKLFQNFFWRHFLRRQHKQRRQRILYLTPSILMVYPSKSTCTDISGLANKSVNQCAS